jgi:hypothetical protein
MTREELLKMIKDGNAEMTMDTLEVFLSENTTKADYTVDAVKEYLKGDENGSRLNDALKGEFLTSFKANGMQKLIDEQVTKTKSDMTKDFELKAQQAKGLTPEQIEINELKKQMDEIKNEKSLLETRNNTTSILKDKNIPVELLDVIIDRTYEKDELEARISNISDVFANHQKALYDSFLKENSNTPIINGAGKTGTTFTNSDVNKMSEAEIEKNYDAIKESEKLDTWNN